MLDFLKKGRADTMNKFIHSLRAANQIHVAQKYLRPAREPDTQSRDGEEVDDESKITIGITSNHTITVTLLQIQPYSQCIDWPFRCLATLKDTSTRFFSDVVVGIEATIDALQPLDDAPKEQSLQQSPGKQKLIYLAKQGQSKNEGTSKQLDNTTKTLRWEQSRGSQEQRHSAKQEQGKNESNGKLATKCQDNWIWRSVAKGTMKITVFRVRA